MRLFCQDNATECDRAGVDAWKAMLTEMFTNNVLY